MLAYFGGVFNHFRLFFQNVIGIRSVVNKGRIIRKALFKRTERPRKRLLRYVLPYFTVKLLRPFVGSAVGNIRLLNRVGYFFGGIFKQPYIFRIFSIFFSVRQTFGNRHCVIPHLRQKTVQNRQFTAVRQIRKRVFRIFRFGKQLRRHIAQLLRRACVFGFF